MVWTVRIAIFALLVINGAITLDDRQATNDLTDQLVDNAIMGARLDAHLARHPDAGLSRRIDRIQGEMDRIEERMRDIEIEHRRARGE